MYRSPFDRHEEFTDLTRRIRETVLSENGRLMKDLGRMLLEARDLCERHHASFEDYLDRVLCLPRSSAKIIVKSHLLDLDPRIGFENMRSVSPEMVKMRYLSAERPADPIHAMERERQRLQKTIRSLQRRLEEIERRIEEYGEAP